MPEEKLLKDENINICPIKEQILLYYGILNLFLLLLYFFYLSYEEPFLGWFDNYDFELSPYYKQNLIRIVGPIIGLLIIILSFHFRKFADKELFVSKKLRKSQIYIQSIILILTIIGGIIIVPAVVGNISYRNETAYYDRANFFPLLLILLQILQISFIIFLYILPIHNLLRYNTGFPPQSHRSRKSKSRSGIYLES